MRSERLSKTLVEMSANADDNKLICRLFCFFEFPPCNEPREKHLQKQNITKMQP